MKFKIVVLLSLIIIISCNSSKNNKIVHMEFCDVTNYLYNIFDTNHLHPPLKYVSLYFFIDQKGVSNIRETNVVSKFIKNNRFIQTEINNKYPSLSLIFYKKSVCTEALMKEKNTKNLPLCNNDIVVEYYWEEGKPSDTLYYKNGIIEGSQKIKIFKTQ